MAEELLDPQTLRELLDLGNRHALNMVLEEAHPHDIAEACAGLDDATLWELLRQIDSPLKAGVFTHLPMERQVQLAESRPPGDAADLLELMPSDDRADLVQALGLEAKQEILQEMQPPQRADVERLVAYPAGTTGSVMSSDVATLRSEMTVDAAISHLRALAGHKETIYYNYVIDQVNTLLGIVSLRDLVTNDGQSRLFDVMNKEPVSVRANDPIEEAANKIRGYDLLALPVVSPEGKLVGIVTVDDVMDATEEETTRDMHKLGGSEALDVPYFETRFRTMIRKRGGWLAALFFGEMLTASAMGKYEGAIARAAVLALFVPLIISSGGNSGSQATSIIIRSLALRELRLRDWWRVFGHELMTGLTLGMLLGMIGFVRIVTWYWFGWQEYEGHPYLMGFAVWLSLIGVVLFGSLVGSMLPFILRRIGFDPAAASAPFVATLVDVTGLVIYFTIATAFLQGVLL